MLAVILLVIKFTRGFVGNMSVLIGVAVGYIVTIALGWTDFGGLQNEAWFRIVLPLQFGVPAFHLGAGPDDVPCDDDRLHRSDRHVPGTRRDDRTCHRKR